MAKHFKEIEIPNQKHFNSLPLPSVLVPNPSLSSPPSLPLLLDSIKSEKSYLESLLHKTGAILFRGFPVSTPSEFNDVVEAFGFDELPYIGGAAPRSQVVGRVYTANESPAHLPIHFHHEMAQVPNYPTKLFFFSEVEPASGGETPLVLSHIVYEKMKEKHPDFVEKLEEHGLIYARVLSEEDNPASPVGRGWKSTFLTDDRSVAEQRASKVGTKLEWLDDGTLMTIMGPIPAIKYDKTRNRKIWFNSAVAAYIGWDVEKKNKGGIKFGNGEPLPGDAIRDCQKILDEESVAIPWQKGDVMLVDNLAVLHARKPFTLPRRVLASLCK